MDRRVFLTGLLGAAGTLAFAASLPRQAEALAIGPVDDITPHTDNLLTDLQTQEIEDSGGTQTAWHHGRPHRRRRVRRRRWRRVCRRYRNRWGHWVRRCRREPVFFWLWL